MIQNKPIKYYSLKTYYIIKNNKTDKFINIDRESGGYPYDCELIFANFFNNIDEATEYYKMFSKENWSLCKYVPSFEVIKWTDELKNKISHISLDEAKDLVALKYHANSWESIRRDYEYGMGVSKLISFEDLMNLVSETYLNNGLL